MGDPPGKPALLVLGAVVVMAAAVAIAGFKYGTGPEVTRLVKAHALATMIMAAPFWLWSIKIIATTRYDSGVVVFALAAASAWRQMRRPHASAQSWYTLGASLLCALVYVLAACITSLFHASLLFLQAYFTVGAAVWCINGIIGWYLVDRANNSETFAPLVI